MPPAQTLPATHHIIARASRNPRARVDSLTAASDGDGGRHDDPGAAGAEEEAEAAAGKVAVAAAGAGETAAAVAAADECVG